MKIKTLIYFQELDTITKPFCFKNDLTHILETRMETENNFRYGKYLIKFYSELELN